MKIPNWILPPDGSAVSLGKSIKNSFITTVKGMQQRRSHGIIPLSLGLSLASLITTVAMRVAAVAETAFRGLTNFFGGLICIPFLSPIKGVKQIIFDLPRTVVLAGLSPLEGLIGAINVVGVGFFRERQRIPSSEDGVEFTGDPIS